MLKTFHSVKVRSWKNKALKLESLLTQELGSIQDNTVENTHSIAFFRMAVLFIDRPPLSSAKCFAHLLRTTVERRHNSVVIFYKCSQALTIFKAHFWHRIKRVKWWKHDWNYRNLKRLSHVINDSRSFPCHSSFSFSLYSISVLTVPILNNLNGMPESFEPVGNTKTRYS